MGKFRSKLKGKAKGRRWAKGQSSSSNPETQKFRNLAKSRFFDPNLGNGNLTTDALKKHDAIQAFTPKTKISQESEMDAEDNESSATTFVTVDSFASEWSSCTDMSFKRFLQVFRSDSALHKEMLAVLAAITEVIKEQGGSGSTTEYYCALLTTLEQVMSVEPKNEDQVTAILSLLNMGIKTVSTSVLRVGFNEVSLKLLHILNDYSSSENNAIIKSILGILGTFLRNQEKAIWTHSTTIQIFSAILNPFCIHSKPKWRKAAQQAVAAILKAHCFLEESGFNPPADKTAEFCEETLSACMGTNSEQEITNVSSVQTGQTTILHVLGLMKETICQFSNFHIKKCCETILRLMTLNYPVVTSCGLQVLHSLFSAQSVVMPAKLNAQLISALYDYQPAATDIQPTLAWMVVMQQAHIHLSDADLAICCAAMPKIIATLTQLWLSERTEIMSATTRTLDALLRDALAPACETSQLVEQHRLKLAKCFDTIELCLGYQYNKAWNQVLHVIRVMLEVAGRNASDLLLNCLKSLAELRDSYQFSYNSELEHAVGAAVRSMGPEVVLSVISLKKENGELNMDRSWLIPNLKENIQRATLNYWIQNILPLAIFCERHSVKLGERNDGIGAHSYELLNLQLWNLFPSFCNNPSDIKDSLKSVAKVLGMAISDRKELRLPVMASLRKLIASAKENEEDLQEIARFGKNYLPILFNLYSNKPVGSDEEGHRLAALDTIKVFLAISNSELTQQLFNHALERLSVLEEETDLFAKESLLDLARALIPYQNTDNIDKLYRQHIMELPTIKNKKEQKKGYKLLEEICSSDSKVCKSFFKYNRKHIQRLLLASIDVAAVTSKSARLKCLIHLIKAQPKLNSKSRLIRSATAEAILSCKDINTKCRTIAYNLLNTIGDRLLAKDQMQEFANMLISGLVGTSQVISASILGISSVLHNFSGSLGKENIQLFLESIANLCTSHSREIVQSCLSFVKVFITSMPTLLVAASLPTVAKALTVMTEDCKRHFRIKVRDILARLVRKYGCESITPHIPTTDTVMYKRLRNLRKIDSRKKKRKEAENQEDSANDDNEEFAVTTKPKSIEEILADSDSDFDETAEVDRPKSKKQTDAWIQEDANTIIDFMEATTSSKITATKPGMVPPQAINKKKSKDRGFKTAADGRLIIEGDSSDSETAHQKTKHDYADVSDSEENEASSQITRILTNRKRKRSDSTSIKSSITNKSQPPFKYKPGGSGIHRAISTSSVYSGIGSEYKSKKAGGDVKKKGKSDPYAYLPLTRSFLNKRKKMKRAGQFKSIVKSARSGAKTGSKMKKYKL